VYFAIKYYKEVTKEDKQQDCTCATNQNILTLIFY